MQAVGGLSLTAGDVEQEVLHPTLVENPQHLECVWNNAFDLAKYVNADVEFVNAVTAGGSVKFLSAL